MQPGIVHFETARELFAKLPDDGKVGWLFDINLANSGGKNFTMGARRCTIRDVVSGGVVITCRIKNVDPGYGVTHVNKRLRPGWDEQKFVRAAAQLLARLHGDAYRISLCEQLYDECKEFQGDQAWDDLVIKLEQQTGRTTMFDEMALGDIAFWSEEVRKWKAYLAK